MKIDDDDDLDLEDEIAEEFGEANADISSEEDQYV